MMILQFKHAAVFFDFHEDPGLTFFVPQYRELIQAIPDEQGAMSNYHAFNRESTLFDHRIRGGELL